MKIGDKVKVVATSDKTTPRGRVGHEGVIVSKHDAHYIGSGPRNLLWAVSFFDAIVECFWTEELELI